MLTNGMRLLECVAIYVKKVILPDSIFPTVDSSLLANNIMSKKMFVSLFMLK